MAKPDKEYRNSGYINVSFDSESRQWSVGGNYTDDKNIQWDLGYAKVGSQGLQDAITLVAKQIGPTIAGKGIPRKAFSG